VGVRILNFYFQRRVRRCARLSQCCTGVRRDFVTAEKSQREHLSCCGDLVPGRVQKDSGVEHGCISSVQQVSILFFTIFQENFLKVLKLVKLGIAGRPGL